MNTSCETSSWFSLLKAMRMAVKTRKMPKRYRIQWYRATSWAPTPIIAPRITSAPRMPQNSTRCWYCAGTRMWAKISAITNTLSALREISIR